MDNFASLVGRTSIAKSDESQKTDDQILIASVYTALTLTVISFSSVAIYKMGRSPSRYNFWFQSEQSRHHAVAGCLLIFGFFILLVTKALLDPTAAIIGSLVYAFVFVPLVSGLVNLRPLQDYFLLLIMWAFHTILTFVSVGLFFLYIVFRWGPNFYGNHPSLQKHIRQLLFFYICKDWLCPVVDSNTYLPFQIFGVLHFLEMMRGSLTADCKGPANGQDDLNSNLLLNVMVAISFCSTMYTSILLSGWPQFNAEFVVICSIYFLLTEVEIIPNDPKSHPLIRILKRFHIWQLCELEFLLVPILVDLVHILMSAFVTLNLTSKLVAAATIYLNIYHPWITLKSTWIYCLELELGYLKLISLPNKDDLLKAQDENDLEGPCCPICYDVLYVCRKTPCGHLFHWSCFRRCYLVSKRCPICRTELELESE